MADLSQMSLCVVLIFFTLLLLSNANTYEKTDCSKLLFGQNAKNVCIYLSTFLSPFLIFCDEPVINPETQQAKDCNRETKTVIVACHAAPNITCHNDSLGFYKHVPCKWTNGHSFETAMLLSIFLGMFGVDRLYLGYPAIGLLKFSTLGFMFLGQLVDILLIATQVVKPADGSDYVIDYYGAVLDRLYVNNDTYIKPPFYE